jgi:hypothetical protein
VLSAVDTATAGLTSLSLGSTFPKQAAPADGLGSGAGAGTAASDGSAAPVGPRYTQESPFLAPISGARYLTAGGVRSDRRVVHMELDLTGSGISYVPGA